MAVLEDEKRDLEDFEQNQEMELNNLNVWKNQVQQ